MTVATAILGRGKTVAGTPLHFGPVPAGETWIVKDVQLLSAGPTSALVQVYGSAPAGTSFVIIRSVTLAGNAGDSSPHWVVLNEGDTFDALSDHEAIWVWISGSRLNGIAV